MLIRRIWICAVLAMVLPLISTAELERLNSVAALVGDTPITLSDVKMQTAPVEQVIYQQFASDPATLRQRILEVRQKALESLIERHLILKDFEKQGYLLPENIIDERVKERIRSDFGDRLTLTKTLQAQGVTYESFRKDIKEQVIVDFLSSKNVSSITLVSPFEIEKYYNANLEKFQQDERIRMRMIYISKIEGNADFSCNMLGDIRRKVIAGGDFSDLARVYHQGSQRAQGGDWGWVDKEVLREDLSSVAFTLEEGQMSEVIRKDEGCYLILVEERQEPRPKPLQSVREEIEKALLAEERNNLKAEWIERLKENSFVRYF
ncbi:MAG: hypothetical protein HOH33_03665 [Verrucomicrobia bacterium]|nr:hypothetical protein [Verrucomicrobiota bacterium]